LSPELAKVILLSDVSADLFYYFGKNPDESERFSQMTLLKAAKEIGKLEDKVAELLKEGEGEGEEKKPDPPPVPPKKKPTNAPTPIIPVKTDGAVDKDPNDMTAREYRAWREKNKG